MAILLSTRSYIFGCAYYPYLHAYFTDKLLSKTVECVSLGYSLQYKGYGVLIAKSTESTFLIMFASTKTLLIQQWQL